ncbi:MAG: DnaJ domain-containing protein [Gaiellaceae bacterium]
MGRHNRDYYRVLGLAPGADQDSIKRAFRGLVHEHHPDVSTDPDAEIRLRGIVEAYEALSQGDQSARDAIASARSRVRGSSSRRAAVVSQVTVDATRARRGTEVGVFFAFERTCGACRGEGLDANSQMEACPSCRGDGFARGISDSDLGRWIQVDTCTECTGTGVVSEPCSSCHGDGRRRDRRRMTVALPPGVRDGARVRVPGAGHVDAAGNVGEGALIVHVSSHVSAEARAVRALAALGVLGGLVLLGLMIAQSL